MSDGRDLRGRFDLAHLAALSFTYLAQRAVSVTRTPERRGAKAEADAMKARRTKIDFIIVLYILYFDVMVMVV